MVEFVEYLYCLGLQLWREVDQVFLHGSLQVKCRRLGWNGLCRPGSVVWHDGRRNWAFLDRPERLAGLSVEYKAESLLRALGDCLHFFTADHHVKQVWCA